MAPAHDPTAALTRARGIVLRADLDDVRDRNTNRDRALIWIGHAELAVRAQAPARHGAVPSMSLPLHWNSAGLPIGVMLTGQLGDEATLFQLAGQLERARPWSDRRPPVLSATSS